MDIGIRKLDIDSHFSDEKCDRKSRLAKIVEAYEALVKKIPEAKGRAAALELMKKELEKENLK